MNRSSKLSHSSFFLLILLYLALALGCATGCQPTDAGSTKTSGDAADVTEAVPLRMLILDDPSLAEVIPFAWQSRMDAQLTVRQLTTTEYLSDVKQALNADVIIFPSRLLGELAENHRIAPLPDFVAKSEQYAWNDIFPIIRQQEIRWAKRIYALPLGSPQLMLLYRQDVLEQLDIKPPVTWQEYDALVARLATTELEPKRVIEPRGVAWAGNMLLARAASYARHRNQYSTLFDFHTMEPLIDAPPFRRALEELLQSNVEAVADPHRAAEQFFAGQAAVAITWPSRARQTDAASQDGHGEKSIAVGFAPLPGSSDVYTRLDKEWSMRNADDSLTVPFMGVAGRLVAITKECKNTVAALNMAQLLSGVEWSSIIGPRSRLTTIFRSAQIAQSHGWVEESVSVTAAKQYGESIQASQSSSSWLLALRIPGQHRYMQTLDEAVLHVLNDDAQPATELTKVAAEWKKITEEYGQKAQRLAYRRSLGLEQ